MLTSEGNQNENNGNENRDRGKRPMNEGEGEPSRRRPTYEELEALLNKLRENSHMDILLHRQEIYRLRDELLRQRMINSPYLPREILVVPPQYFPPGPLSFDPDLMNGPALPGMRIEVPPRMYRAEPMIPMIPMGLGIQEVQDEPLPPAQVVENEENHDEHNEIQEEAQGWMLWESESDSDDSTIINPPNAIVKMEIRVTYYLVCI